MPTLFIGMPVFNGGRFIERALDSLINQTFTDWTLLISDNCSTDDTARICEVACERDNRISYFKQSTNVGVIDNFKFLLEKANTKYFMWAAADDLWDKLFLEVCVNGLNMDPQTGLAFTNIVNIDSLGRIIREYPSLKPFSHPNPYVSIANFILTPEYLGKANLIYGVYRLDMSLKSYMLNALSTPKINNYGFDMAYSLGVLCRTGLFIDDRILFKKRYVRHKDHFGVPQKITPEIPYVYGVPRNDDFLDYKQLIITASRDTHFEDFVVSLMDYRHNLTLDVELILYKKKWILNNCKALLNRFRKIINCSLVE